MRSYWIRVGLKSNMICVLRRREKLGHRHVHKKKACETQAEWCLNKPRSSKDCQQTTGSQVRGLEQSPWEPAEEINLADILVFRLLAPGTGKIHFSGFKLPNLWHLVIAALENQYIFFPICHLPGKWRKALSRWLKKKKKKKHTHNN